VKEIKVPGEVRQLVKKWRREARLLKLYDGMPATLAATLGYCADELEEALKRPIQRERIRAKRSKKT
jgi:hypothetical protein